MEMAIHDEGVILAAEPCPVPISVVRVRFFSHLLQVQQHKVGAKELGLVSEVGHPGVLMEPTHCLVEFLFRGVGGGQIGRVRVDFIVGIRVALVVLEPLESFKMSKAKVDQVLLLRFCEV